MSGHLSLNETLEVLIKKGLPRNPRSVRRYCKNGMLRCEKQDTGNGYRYVVDRTSLDNFIVHQKQLLGVNTNGREPVVPGRDRADEGMTGPLSGDVHPERPAPAAISDDGKDRLIEVLTDQLHKAEVQLHSKDEQLATYARQFDAMLERSRETNILIQGTQTAMTKILEGLPAPDVSRGARKDANGDGSRRLHVASSVEQPDDATTPAASSAGDQHAGQ